MLSGCNSGAFGTIAGRKVPAIITIEAKEGTMDYLPQEISRIANAAGHTRVEGFETLGGKFFVRCACGYRSTNRRTVRLAIEAGIHHLNKVAREFVASGVSVAQVERSRLNRRAGQSQDSLSQLQSSA